MVSPNPIGCADVCYMLRGSRLTLSHLLVEGLIYLTGAMFGRSPMPLLLKLSREVDIAWHMRARELFLFTRALNPVEYSLS